MNGVDVGLVGHGAAGTDGVGRTQVFKGRHCVNVFFGCTVVVFVTRRPSLHLHGSGVLLSIARLLVLVVVACKYVSL